MFNKFIQIFKIPELRNKILFVLGVFVVFRIMANIPIIGVDPLVMQRFFGAAEIFGFLNLFTGGALDQLSIVMLGLGPYITATIIMQLLTMIFPALNAMYKEEGETGRQKFNQYARMLTVPFAALQSYGMLALLQGGADPVIGELSFFVVFTWLLTVTAGTLFLMWLGELITEKGIGNGVSLLIFAGIISMFPMQIRELLIGWEPAMIPTYLLFLGIALLIIAGVVLVNEGRRNIPVSYAKRVRGMKMYGGSSTYLPLNINPAGVMPIIFAMSIILLPGMVARFFINTAGPIGAIAQAITNFIENPFAYGLVFFLMIVIFTYFYTAVTFDPKAISTNLQKMGGFIPGIRPGQSTASFIYFILNRVLLIGAIFLGIIAVMPSIIAGVTGVGVFQFLIGGTATLIIVSVVLETMRQIKAQLQMREYESF